VQPATSIQQALDASVRSFEHGQMADEAAMRLIYEKGAWWFLSRPRVRGDNLVMPEEMQKPGQQSSGIG
jgi:hypothetical protein